MTWDTVRGSGKGMGTSSRAGRAQDGKHWWQGVTRLESQPDTRQPRQRGLQQSAAQPEGWDNKMPFPAVRALAAGSFGFFYQKKKKKCVPHF